MAHANVSNGVLTIISSFSNGLDVLKKLRRSSKAQHSKGKKRKDEDALRLSRSLRHGPEEIGREYQAGSMHCDSEQYAMGDATAQTSLAEILLKLNTGIVGIITSFLNRDKHNGLHLDYQSLTNLSEQSRVQTIDVLRQLYQRLIAKRMPSKALRIHDNKTKSNKPSRRASTKHVKKRHPVLARVLIENSSIPSQIAMVRPSETRKQRSTTHSRSSSEPPKSHFESTPAASSLDLLPLPPPYFQSESLPKQEAPTPNKPLRHRHSKTSLLNARAVPKLTHDPSRASATNDTSSPDDLGFFKTQPTTPASRSDLYKPRPLRPNTLYSIGSARTGSTKLGEIPMHKWAEPWDHEAAEKANMEALATGWPTNVGEKANKPRKAGWKRWFGKRAEAT